MDQPASLIEKYMGLRAHYLEQGKRFDSKPIKEVVIKMWMEGKNTRVRPTDLDRLPEEVFEESEERARAIRFDEREAKDELEAARKAGEERMKADREGAMFDQVAKARIAELEAQLAAAQGNAPAAPAPVSAPSGYVAGPTVAPVAVPEGVPWPELEWTKNQMLDWTDVHKIQVYDSMRKNASKTELLDYILRYKPVAV